MDVFAAMTAQGRYWETKDPRCQIKGAERINVRIEELSENTTQREEELQFRSGD